MSISVRPAGVAALAVLLTVPPGMGAPAVTATATGTLWVEGMTLPDCDDVGLELLLESLPGVEDVQIVFTSGETTVRYDSERVGREAIIAEVVNRGFRVAWVADVFVVSGWSVPARDALAVRLLVESLDGVDRVDIEEASGRALVRYDPARVSAEVIAAEIRNLDYAVARDGGTWASGGR